MLSSSYGLHGVRHCAVCGDGGGGALITRISWDGTWNYDTMSALKGRRTFTSPRFLQVVWKGLVEHTVNTRPLVPLIHNYSFRATTAPALSSLQAVSIFESQARTIGQFLVTWVEGYHKKKSLDSIRIRYLVSCHRFQK